MLLSGVVLKAEEALSLGPVTDIVETEEQLEDLLGQTLATACRLDPETVGRLHGTTDLFRDDDVALAALVRSASRPGLAERIRSYQARLRTTAKSAPAS